MSAAKLLETAETALLVVDVQEKFRLAIPEFGRMLEGCVRLVQTFRELERPVLVTEQYPKGLGETVPELLEALGYIADEDEDEGEDEDEDEDSADDGEETGEAETTALDDPEPALPAIPSKTSFSSLGCPEIGDALREQAVRSVVVCGIESHVCVLQTVLGLLDLGLAVHVVADAVASRSEGDRQHALERMARAGAVVTTSETAAFELLRDASHDAFKPVQRLFR